MRYSLSLAASISFLITISGCAGFTPASPDDPFYAPVIPQTEQKPPVANGAIYNPMSAGFLLEERKARRVGDLITVLLVESTNAQSKADTKLKKEFDNSFDAPVLLNDAADALPIGVDLGSKRKNTAEAESKQNNRLSGTITVHVAQVLANGNLVIRGEKWVQVNRGNEYIRLSGIVRPEDVSASNTVDSTRVGNARISYSGTGELAEANTQGWLSRFFNSPWWPF
ncbi:MAG: flagellar basal body L-ring protein FlgH [Gammaproteobacteria bacterium]|nr:flagellar basal body L-ring protein FlgH [Gammaproteobacteria bacterium]